VSISHVQIPLAQTSDYHHAEVARLQLGRALEANGQLAEAKDALRTAHNKAVQHSSPHLNIFSDALDKINQKLRQE
jgi:uncharacterized protein HemY